MKKPIFDGYVGGDFYFKDSEDKNSLASHIYESISMEELPSLKKQDRRSFKVEEALTSNKIAMLRKRIMNFIVGACIRRIQQRKAGERERKYSLVVHTEHGKQAHAWQEYIVNTMKELLVESIRKNPDTVSQLVRTQQDTVLQHSRMFGYRKTDDLAVTRFYTAQNIHEVMKRINEFDTGLREEFEKGVKRPVWYSSTRTSITE